MDDLIKQLSAIARGMWKYRHLGMGVAWATSAVVAVFVMLMQDRYEASARVHVDTESILRPLMTGLAVQPNVEQQVQMLSRTLISRPTMERLVRAADLDLAAKTKNDREDLIDKVTKSIQVKSTGKDNLYTLTYRDTSPERAQRVVQSLLTIFVESSLGASKTDTDSARRFLDEQIKAYESKLTEAETRLKEFKLKNLDIQMTGEGDSAARLSTLSNELNQAQLQLREAESARDAARRQLDQARNITASPSGLAAPILTPEIDARIDGQRRALDALLQRFTEEHPDVINGRRLLRELEDQKRREVAERRAQAGKTVDPTIESSPAVLELSKTLAGTEVQVAALRARVSEYAGRMARLKEVVKLAPEMESELSQLNRDYEIHKKNYNDLVSRRESAAMSSELESSSSVADFRVIDPPRALSAPVAPNRALLMPLALVAGLAAGLGVAFVLSQIRPVFFDAAALHAVSELPLLGVVQLVVSDEIRRQERRSLRRFMAAFFALVVIFGVVVVWLAYRSGLMGA